MLVADLDAVDGTPGLNIKPHMAEMRAHTEVVEPTWANELMEHYWTQQHGFGAPACASRWGWKPGSGRVMLDRVAMTFVELPPWDPREARAKLIASLILLSELDVFRYQTPPPLTNMKPTRPRGPIRKARLPRAGQVRPPRSC